MGKNILVRDNRDPLFGLSRKEAVEAVRLCFACCAEKVYAYGSFAREDMHSGSDLDLIVVMETELPFPSRGILTDCIRDRIPSAEVLVYTPEEFTVLTENPTAGFWKSVTEEMVRLV